MSPGAAGMCAWLRPTSRLQHPFLGLCYGCIQQHLSNPALWYPACESRSSALLLIQTRDGTADISVLRDTKPAARGRGCALILHMSPRFCLTPSAPSCWKRWENPGLMSNAAVISFFHRYGVSSHMPELGKSFCLGFSERSSHSFNISKQRITTGAKRKRPHGEVLPS